MKGELSAAVVAARLAALRALSDGATSGAPDASAAFAKDVGMRLAELRALLELTDHLHRARLP